MPRYENGTKFIDLRLRGKTVVTTSGRIGGTFKTREAWFPAPEAAEARFVGDIAAAKAKEFVHLSRLHRTVADPALEAAIVEQPDDDGARIVYGDWLLERGDRRGDLAALHRQIAVARPDKARTLRNRERELLEEYSSVLFGELDEVLHAQVETGPVVEATWRHGFFDSVTLRFPDVANGRLPSLLQATEGFVTLHSARFLREIRLAGAVHYRGSLMTLAKLPPTLRSLAITSTIGRNTFGHFRPFCRRHAGLRRLALEVGNDPLHGLELPALEHLELRMPLFDPYQLDALVRAPWPELGSLDLAIAAYTIPTQAFTRLLTTDILPRLRTLRLAGSATAGFAMADALAASRLPAQLEQLIVVGANRAVQLAFTERIARPITFVGA